MKSYMPKDWGLTQSGDKFSAINGQLNKYSAGLISNFSKSCTYDEQKEALKEFLNRYRVIIDTKSVFDEKLKSGEISSIVYKFSFQIWQSDKLPQGDFKKIWKKILGPL